MNITLEISSNERDSTQLMRQMNNIHNLLLRENAIIVRGHPVQEQRKATQTEEKAEPVTLTALILGFVTSGAAAALIHAIIASSPDARLSSITYRLFGDDGKTIKEFDGTCLTQKQVDHLIESVEQTVSADRDEKTIPDKAE